MNGVQMIGMDPENPFGQGETKMFGSVSDCASDDPSHTDPTSKVRKSLASSLKCFILYFFSLSLVLLSPIFN